jgi:hypothetical protein
MLKFPSLLIYQNLNNATPEFYVVYNYQEEVPTSLYPYKFKFDIQTNGVSMPAIMTFLWIQIQLDPEEQKLKYRVNIINRIIVLFIKNQKIF